MSMPPRPRARSVFEGASLAPLAAALLAAVVASGCTLDPVDYTGKSCVAGDCPFGYGCDPATATCLPLEQLQRDAGADGGPRDSGAPVDAGRDAGPADSGPVDAGPPDAGPPDAGPPDAGPPDAGPDCSTVPTMCPPGEYCTPQRACAACDVHDHCGAACGACAGDQYCAGAAAGCSSCCAGRSCGSAPACPGVACGACGGGGACSAAGACELGVVKSLVVDNSANSVPLDNRPLAMSPIDTAALYGVKRRLPPAVRAAGDARLQRRIGLDTAGTGLS